jgi:6-phosphogluconolactonase
MTLRLVYFAFCALTILSVSMNAEGQAGKATTYWVFVGTGTGGKAGSKGIYRLELDPAKGTLSTPELAAETEQPTFLAIHPNSKFLYSVGEYAKLGDKKTGSLNAFALDAKTGKLTFLNQQSSGGGGPCHVLVDRDGKCLFAANYNTGSICCLPIKSDGSLAEATAFIQHQGSSIVKGRQEGPHAHSVNIDAANRIAVAADLGVDKLFIYRFDPNKGTLQPNDPPALELAKGAGPRHFAFHPNGKFAYAINELDSTITALSYDAAKGELKPLQTVTTLPQPTKGNSTAEVVVHPNGKFLYGSNRGHNSIASFTIDEKTGQLTPTGHQDKEIKIPRNFALDPTGTLLIVANQDGNSLVMFRVDQKTGQLSPTGVHVDVPRPMCVRFLPKG